MIRRPANLITFFVAAQAALALPASVEPILESRCRVQKGGGQSAGSAGVTAAVLAFRLASRAV